MAGFGTSHDTSKEAFDSLPDELVEKPYTRIWEKYNHVYPKAGKEFMKYGALNPISTYAPDIERPGDTIRTRCNVMVLTNSGGAKSSLLSECEKMTPDPYPIGKETEANVEKSIAYDYQGYKPGNLIVNDLNRIMSNEGLLKAFETMIGEGRVQRSTDDYDIDEKVNVSLVGAGVPSDINSKITGGFLFRVIPIVIRYDEQDQFDIGDHLMESVSNGEVENNEKPWVNEYTKQDIYDYYAVLENVIDGRYSDHDGISGYVFSKEQTAKIKDEWENVLKKTNAANMEAIWFRQLYDGIRYAAVSAIVNLPQRELQDDPDSDDNEKKVVVTDEDINIGSLLMRNGVALIADYLSKEQVKAKMEEIQDFDNNESKKAMEELNNM